MKDSGFFLALKSSAVLQTRRMTPEAVHYLNTMLLPHAPCHHDCLLDVKKMSKWKRLYPWFCASFMNNSNLTMEALDAHVLNVGSAIHWNSLAALEILVHRPGVFRQTLLGDVFSQLFGITWRSNLIVSCHEDDLVEGHWIQQSLHLDSAFTTTGFLRIHMCP